MRSIRTRHNPSLQPTGYGCLRQPSHAADLKSWVDTMHAVSEKIKGLMKHTSSALAILGVLLTLSFTASGLGRPVSNGNAADPSKRLSHGVLVPAPAMSVARAAHTATALPDGRVLVAGGFVEKGSARAAEVWSVDAGRFTALPPMVATRHSHTATLLPDGRVLIAGGSGEGATTLAAAEIFDPATNSFASTGPLLAARANHIAVLLDDGKVLIAGGVGPGWDFLSSAELYDPATGRFLSTGNMSVARESHVGVRLLDGRVLIVGGHRGRRADITIHASAELYDTSMGVFTRAGDMRTRRHKHDAVLLPDGHVLVTAGSDERDERGMYDSSELFDPKMATFIAGPQMKLARHKHAGTSLVLPNGLVLISGGAPQAEVYDPHARTFAVVAGAARMAGQFSAVAPLTGGRALITGGYGNGGGPRSSTWLYWP